MNHGVGSMDKMHVQNGQLDYDTGFHGDTAVLYIKGKMFRVEPLSAEEWLWIIVCTSPVMIAGELIRAVSRLRKS